MEISVRWKSNITNITFKIDLIVWKSCTVSMWAGLANSLK